MVVINVPYVLQKCEKKSFIRLVPFVNLALEFSFENILIYLKLDDMIRKMEILLEFEISSSQFLSSILFF